MSCNLYRRECLKILNSKNDYSLEGFTLSNEQNDICKNILTNYGGVINSQAGTGKTLVSLSIAQHLINIDANNTMQVCIVCPVKAVNSFKKELTTKINQPFSIYTVKEYNIVKDARYHIFTYTKLSELEQFIVDYEYHNGT
jgi:superfamily II DNA or RNA helicase